MQLVLTGCHGFRTQDQDDGDSVLTNDGDADLPLQGN